MELHLEVTILLGIDSRYIPPKITMYGQKQQQSSPEQEPVGTDLSSLNALAQVEFLQAQRDETDLGCADAPLVPQGYGGGPVQEAAS